MILAHRDRPNAHFRSQACLLLNWTLEVAIGAAKQRRAPSWQPVRENFEIAGGMLEGPRWITVLREIHGFGRAWSTEVSHLPNPRTWREEATEICHAITPGDQRATAERWLSAVFTDDGPDWSATDTLADTPQSALPFQPGIDQVVGVFAAATAIVGVLAPRLRNPKRTSSRLLDIAQGMRTNVATLDESYDEVTQRATAWWVLACYLSAADKLASVPHSTVKSRAAVQDETVEVAEALRPISLGWIEPIATTIFMQSGTWLTSTGVTLDTLDVRAWFTAARRLVGDLCPQQHQSVADQLLDIEALLATQSEFTSRQSRPDDHHPPQSIRIISLDNPAASYFGFAATTTANSPGTVHAAAALSASLTSIIGLDTQAAMGELLARTRDYANLVP